MLEELNNRMRVLRIMWGAFLVVPVNLGVVLFMLGDRDLDPDLTLPLMLCVTGVVQFFVAFFVRKIMMGTVALMPPNDLRVDNRTPEDMLNQPVLSALNRYYTGTVVSMAIAEAITLFGFVGTFLNGSPVFFAAMTGLGVLLLLIVTPRVGGMACILSPEDRKGLLDMLAD